MAARFVLGIDLGTTNCVLAFARIDAGEPRIELFSVPQLVAASTLEPRSTLASFAYLASGHEARDRALGLPWAAERNFAVGEFARRQGAARSRLARRLRRRTDGAHHVIKLLR